MSDEEDYDDMSESRPQVMPFSNPPLDASMQNLSDYLTDYQEEEAAAVVQSARHHSGNFQHSAGSSVHFDNGHMGHGSTNSVHFASGSTQHDVSSSDSSPHRDMGRRSSTRRGRGGLPVCDLALGFHAGFAHPDPESVSGVQSSMPHTGEFHRPRSESAREREFHARSPANDSIDSVDAVRDVAFDMLPHEQLTVQQQPSQQAQGQQQRPDPSNQSVDVKLHPSALRPTANAGHLRPSLRHTPGHVHHASAMSEDSVSVGAQRQKSQSFADLNTAIAAMGSFGSGGSSVRWETIDCIVASACCVINALHL